VLIVFRIAASIIGFSSIIPLSHILPFVMEVDTDMLHTIFPMNESMTAETTSSRKVTIHREMRASHVVVAWNMGMKIVEMLQEVLLSVVEPPTRCERLVAANCFLVCLEVVHLRVGYSAVCTDLDASDDYGSGKVADPSFLWPVHFFVFSPIVPVSEFLSALSGTLEWFVVVS